MPIEEKEILIREIRNYQGDIPLIDILSSLFIPKDRIKTLINNNAGVIASLLDKYKNELDDVVLKAICISTVFNEYFFEDKEERYYNALDECLNVLVTLNLVEDKDCLRKEILEDKEVVKLFVSWNIITDEVINCLSANSSDREFFLEMLAFSSGAGWILSLASEQLRDDETIVLNATEYCPDVFKYASDRLKKDKKFILDAMSNNFNFDGTVFLFIDEELKKDIDFVKKVIKATPDAFQYIDDNLKNDKEFVKEMLVYSANIFEFCSYEIKNDPEIVYSAVSYGSMFVRYIGKELLNNYDFMYKCYEKCRDNLFIYQWGLALVDCNRYDYFLNIIREDKRFLEPVCIYYRNSYDFMIEAAKIDVDSLKYLGFDLANNVEFVLDLISAGIDIIISDDMYEKINEIYNS